MAVGDETLFDDLLATLKTGKWNYYIFLMASILIIQSPFHIFSGAFTAPAVPHSCISVTPSATPPTHVYTPSLDTSTPARDPLTPRSPIIAGDSDLDNDSYGLQNSFYLYGNETFLYSNESLECALPGESANSCTAWAFNTSTYGSSLTSEFELVCDKQVIRPLYNSMYFFGGFVGAPISGWMTDRFGRTRVFVLGYTLAALFANVIPWVHHLTSILACRFCLGFLLPTSLQASFCLVMEVFEQKWRATAGIIIFLPWPLGMVVMAGVCYLVKDWRWQTFYLSLPALLLLPLFWKLDESPRWLIVQGHQEKALKTLRKAARWNKTSLPPADQLQGLMKDITNESADKSRNTISSTGMKSALWRLFDSFAILLRTREIRKITLAVNVIMLFTSLSYFGLSLGGDLFSSDPYIYMVISAVMEVPGATLTIPLVERFGRRRSNAVMYLITGVSLICLTFIPSKFESAVMGVALLGRLTITAAFQIVYLNASELFPTEVRVLATGICSMMIRIGSLLASFLVGALPSTWIAAPSAIFGCTSLLASCATLMLPETRGTPLFDTVASLEAAMHSRRTKKRRKVQSYSE